TNLVIDTDRRTYHLELRSGPAAYMAEVSWRYPQDGLLAIRQASPPPMTLAWPAAPSPMAAPALDLDRLDFRYRIVGPKVSWRPLQAFDDGRQTFIEFPADIAEKDLPPLFLLGPDGKSLQLVNYRVQGRHMVVDRIFQTAALQMGDRRSEARVLIERER
ncbi:MAG: TrbG/VirB9 family P-type conjugative transfer protein, partial [Caulobacteraceae bacterium]